MGDIWKKILELCLSLSNEWIQKAIASDEQLIKFFSSAQDLGRWRDNPNKTTIREIWPAEEFELLARFFEALKSATIARYECRTMNGLLNRIRKRGDWQDTYVDAVGELPTLLRVADANGKPAILSPLVDFAGNVAPKVDGLFPLFRPGDLTDLRRTIDRIRKRADRSPERNVTQYPLDENYDACVDTFEQEPKLRFRAALSQMDPVLRQFMILHYEGRPLREIAKLCGVSISNACSRIAKAVVELKRIIDQS